MRLSCLFLLVCLVCGATACADPQGAFDAFNQRQMMDSTSTGTGGASGDGGTCTPPAAGALDGPYFFTLSAKISPKLPVVFTAQLTTTAGSDGLTFSLGNLQALCAADRKTPEPPAVASLGPFTVGATGAYTA